MNIFKEDLQMKKLLSWCFVFLLLVTLDIPSLAAQDEPSSWAKALVGEAITKGYVPEHLQGDYKASITREEFAELFVTAVFSEVNRQEVANAGEATKYRWHFQELTVDNFLSKVSTTEKFTDTESKYVKVANMLGMVNGVGDGRFNPDGFITREQACIMFVNYFQTVANTDAGSALEQLDDIDQVSSWAKRAVIWAYGANFLKGTREYQVTRDENGFYTQIKQLGHFAPTDTFTREQAIVVVNRLGNPSKNYINNIILRGYLRINMDVLMSGFEIEGNIIKMKKSGYDAKYSYIKEYFKTQARLKEYISKYNTEQLIAAVWTPHGAQFDTTDNSHMDKILSGKKSLYDYSLFTIEHNKDGYLSIITKKDFKGYFEYAGGILFHRPDDWNGPPIAVSGKEIK